MTEGAFLLRYSLFESDYEGFSRETSRSRVENFRASVLLRHHFRDGFAANLQVPTSTVGATDAFGNDQRLNGFGDIRLGARYDLSVLWNQKAYLPNVALNLGMALPSGQQQRFEQEDSQIPITILATGRGAFALAFRAEATQFVQRSIAVKAWAGVDLPITKNALGISNGLQVDYGVGLLYLVNDWLFANAQIGAQYLAQAKTPSLDIILNSGGNVVAGEMMLGVRPTDDLTLAFGARAPIWVGLNGRQVGESFTILTSISTRFGASADEDEHDHDHGDAHDHGDVHDDGDAHDHGDGDAESHDVHKDAHDHGDVHVPANSAASAPAHEPDIKDASTKGDDFVISNVVQKGRVTVIDFWSEWCAPCEDISKMMTRLAKKHSGLSVRKVEVPDFECAAAKTHLKNVAGLPVIWIYGKNGERVAVFESAEFKKIEQAIEKALLAK